MSHKIIVHTEQGKPDSLMEPVQVFFKLTLPEAVTHPYDTLAIGCMSFNPDMNGRGIFGWRSGYAFTGYSESGDNSVWGNRGRYDTVVTAQPGDTCWRLDSPGTTPHRPEEWDPSLFHPGETSESTIRIANATSGDEHISMQIGTAGSNHAPILAFKPLVSRGIITILPNLELQAYVVRNRGIVDGRILTPEDLTTPLFDKPIKCDSLRPWSKWRLSQSFDGTISLKIDEETRSVGSHSIESVAKSVNELRNDLAAVMASLDITQQRLATVETAVANNHTDLSTSLNDTRDQLSRLDQVVPSVQAKITEFEAFVARAERRPVGAARMAVGSRERGTRSDRGLALTEPVERSSPVQRQEGGPANGRPSSNHRDHSSHVTTSIDSLTQPPAVVEPSIRALDVAAPEPAEPRVPTPRLTGLRRSARTPQAETEAISAEVPSQARGSFVLQESLRTLRQQVAGLDRRIPTLEAKSDKLAKQVGHTQESLSSVERFTQVTRDQVSELELKLPAVEDRMDQLTESIVTTEDYLEDLALRVTAVEDRAEMFAETLGDIRDLGSDAWGSPSPTDNPSAQHPSGLADGSRSVVGASEPRSPSP